MTLAKPIEVDGPLPDRIWNRITVNSETGCWESTLSLNAQGYTQVRWKGRTMRLHRLIYTHLVGPVPLDIHLDHLCRNRACCNPRHIEPVSGRENVMRGDGFASVNANKTHCPRDHEYDARNTYHDSTGARRCRQCARLTQNERRRQRRNTND